MVTLHILQLLQDNSFGVIDATSNGLFYESLPLDVTGVAIYSRGTSLERGKVTTQSFDLYSRGKTNLLGADKLEKILSYFKDNFVQCQLPTTPKSLKKYLATTITPTSNVENLGLDENDRVVFRVSADIKYKLGE